MQASGNSRNGAAPADIAVSLGLIAIAFLPFMGGGYSGWGYILAHLLLPLSAMLCLLLRPADAGRRLLLPTILTALFAIHAFHPVNQLQQGQVLLLYALCFVTAWIVADTALRHSPQRAALLLPVLSVAAALTALYGLLDWMMAGHIDYHVISFFGLHNAYAGFLLLSWPLGIMLFFERDRSRRMQWLGLACSLLCLLALVLTYSRAAWVMFALQLFFLLLAMLLRGGRRYAGALRWGGISIVALLAILLTMPPIRDVLARVGDFAGYSFQGRLRFWDAAWQIYLDHPLWGAGLGNFAYTYPQYQKDYVYYSIDPHSWPLQMAAELGTPGLLLALVLLVLFFIWAGRVLRSAAALPWRLALVAAVGGSLAHAAVDFDYTFSSTNVFMGVLLAMGSFAAARNDRKADADAAPKRPDGLAIACALLLLVACLRAPALSFERFYLDELRGMIVETPQQAQARLELLNRAISYNPRNSDTRYDRAALLANTSLDPQRLPPEQLEEIRRDLDIALKYNPRSVEALFLKGTLNPSSAAGSRDVEAAIELDPYNYPAHYYGWALLSDEPAEQLRRLELGMQRIPITEPVTPRHVRPTFYKYNGLFSQWYERMMELTDDPELKKEYRSRAAAFRTYYENNQLRNREALPNA